MCIKGGPGDGTIGPCCTAVEELTIGGTGVELVLLEERSFAVELTVGLGMLAEETDVKLVVDEMVLVVTTGAVEVRG